ncbi:MAG: hypothetical protein HOJ31_10260 [Anaerolineae bacterium]|jgi:hypothetical protein|nr:hypothetical protein [Anaerolineae bacterium]
MKFTSRIKGLKVYHAKRKALLSFIDGVYETDDQAEIALLSVVKDVETDSMDGVPHLEDENIEPVEEVDLATEEELSEMSLAQLRNYAKKMRYEIHSKARSAVDYRAAVLEAQTSEEE